MGTGIALTLATAGFPVSILDVKDRPEAEYPLVERRTFVQLQQNLSFMVDITGKPLDEESILGRIAYSHEPEEALSGSGFVFEAVPERPELKLETLRRIEPHLEPEAVIGSTTSTIDLGTLRKGLDRSTRLLITHWLNPAFLIPVVELARGEDTDPDAVERMRGLLIDVGKLPILLWDSPGFIVPRIQALAMNEGVRMLEEGVAEAADIDRAITYGFAFRLCCMGLMEFIDVGGLDILYNADTYLEQAVSSERFRAPEMVRAKMEAGDLGIKTGRGIYDWDGRDVPELVKSRFRSLHRLLEHLADDLQREIAATSPQRAEDEAEGAIT